MLQPLETFLQNLCHPDLFAFVGKTGGKPLLLRRRKTLLPVWDLKGLTLVAEHGSKLSIQAKLGGGDA